MGQFSSEERTLFHGRCFSDGNLLGGVLAAGCGTVVLPVAVFAAEFLKSLQSQRLYKACTGLWQKPGGQVP
jgi:hypothetical protein